MDERKLLAELYEKTLNVDVDKAVERTLNAFTEKKPVQRSKFKPRLAYALSSTMVVAALTVSILLISLIGGNPPQIPPEETPAKFYTIEEIDTITLSDIEALKSVYNGNLDLFDFNCFQIVLYRSKEESPVNLYFQLDYKRLQKEALPDSLLNTDNIQMTVLLANNFEYKADDIFEGDFLDQILNYVIGDKELEVKYHDDWNENTFNSSAIASFAFNGCQYFIKTSYLKYPGFTTENMICDIVEQLFDLK